MQTSVVQKMKRLSIPIVSTEWIIQCLIKGELMDMEAHARYKHDYCWVLFEWLLLQMWTGNIKCIDYVEDQLWWLASYYRLRCADYQQILFMWKIQIWTKYTGNWFWFAILCSAIEVNIMHFATLVNNINGSNMEIPQAKHKVMQVLPHCNHNKYSRYFLLL